MAGMIRSNAHYQDPALAKAFDDLASAFGPPKGSEMYAYAHANAERQKADRLAAMFAYARDPDYNQQTADRLGIMGGLFQPNQSYYSVDQNNATELKKNEATNRTTLDKARIDNEGELTRQNAKPVLVNENQTAFLPQQTAAATGLPGMFAGQRSVNQGETIYPAGGGEPIQGQPKPMSDAEVRGAILRGLPQNEQRAAALQGVPVETVTRPDNTAELVFRPDAVGRTPVLDEGKAAKPQVANYKLPDMQGKPGMAGTAIMKNGVWFDSQTGEKLPPGAVTYSATLTGDKSGTGLGPTTSNTTDANKRAAEATRTLNTLDLYEGLVRNNPGVVGIPGLIRGTAQNAVAVAQDVAKSFGKTVPQIEEAAGELKNGLSKVAPEYFDPKIPEAQFYQGTLAYALARTENPSGEVSRQAFERALDRVRGGVLTNPDQILATLGAFRKTLETERNAIGVLQNPTTARTDTNYQAPPGATPPAAAPQVEKWMRGPDGKLMRAQ